jgi:DNA-binding LacI/PurR family transcriptional regulator
MSPTRWRVGCGRAGPRRSGSSATSCVALPHPETGAWAVETVLDLIEEAAVDGDRPLQKLMPCPLVRRDSVGPPPADRPSPPTTTHQG